MTSDPGGRYLQAEAIRVLTEAARQTCNDGSPSDFADFLAAVLAATAANVGGTERLLAGRPGSWEATLIHSLLVGTVGADPSELLRVRTEPVFVTLNVAEMLEGLDPRPGLLTVDEAMDVCEQRLRDDERSADDKPAIDAAIAAIENRYAQEFAAYAARFAAAVLAVAAQTGGDRLRVLIEADSDPRSDWWSDDALLNVPTSGNDDGIAHRLWHAAHDGVALPNIDIDPRVLRSSVCGSSTSGDGPGPLPRAE